jgi:hypothetical protein
VRLLFDSDTPEDLPDNAMMVGGYVNGKKPWGQADWLRFAHAKHVRINRTGELGRGNCLDVENGLARAADAPRWFDSVDWCRKSELAIYCNRSSAAAVIRAMGQRPWIFWLATLDGTQPRSYAGRHVDAVQYLGSFGLGFHADLSAVFNDRWHA